MLLDLNFDGDPNVDAVQSESNQRFAFTCQSFFWMSWYNGCKPCIGRDPKYNLLNFLP